MEIGRRFAAFFAQREFANLYQGPGRCLDRSTGRVPDREGRRRVPRRLPLHAPQLGPLGEAEAAPPPDEPLPAVPPCRAGGRPPLRHPEGTWLTKAVRAHRRAGAGPRPDGRVPPRGVLPRPGRPRVGQDDRRPAVRPRPGQGRRAVPVHHPHRVPPGPGERLPLARLDARRDRGLRPDAVGGQPRRGARGLGLPPVRDRTGRDDPGHPRRGREGEAAARRVRRPVRDAAAVRQPARLPPPAPGPEGVLRRAAAPPSCCSTTARRRSGTSSRRASSAATSCWSGPSRSTAGRGGGCT